MTDQLTGVKVAVELHWGFSVKRPIFSAAQPALIVPPPTTLLGALARAAAVLKGWSEVEVRVRKQRSRGRRGAGTSIQLYSSAVRILEDVPWATLALIDERYVSPMLGLIETRDIIRALIAPYQRGENIYVGSPYIYGIQPHGRVYAPSMRVHVLYLARSREAEKWAYLVQSIGSKESIVSVASVRVGEVRVRSVNGNVETRYYFPAYLGEVHSGSFVRELLSRPAEEHYLLGSVHDLAGIWEEFIIPLECVSVKPSGEAAVIEDPDGELVLVPREVI